MGRYTKGNTVILGPAPCLGGQPGLATCDASARLANNPDTRGDARYHKGKH